MKKMHFQGNPLFARQQFCEINTKMLLKCKAWLFIKQMKIYRQILNVKFA